MQHERRPEPAPEETEHPAPPDAPPVDLAWQQVMLTLARSEELCDVVFVVGGTRLPALRHLCALHSEPLAMLFGEDWRDRPHGGDLDVGALVQLDGDVLTPLVFGAVLDFVHSGRAETIDAGSAVPILMLADYLQIKPLKRRCGHWVATSLDPKNVIGIFESALAVHEEGLVASCLAVIEQHTEAVLADPAFLTTVTEETLCRILASPKLNVADELTLYSKVVAWGESVHAARRGGRSLAEVVAKPMSHVRLGLIPPLELSTVVLAAGIAPLQDVALALAFQSAGRAAVPDADAPQFTARTGTQDQSTAICTLQDEAGGTRRRFGVYDCNNSWGYTVRSCPDNCKIHAVFVKFTGTPSEAAVAGHGARVTRGSQWAPHPSSGAEWFVSQFDRPVDLHANDQIVFAVETRGAVNFYYREGTNGIRAVGDTGFAIASCTAADLHNLDDVDNTFNVVMKIAFSVGKR